MKKHVSRIIASLLVPCLIADPMIPHSSATRVFKPAISSIDLFRKQALSERPVVAYADADNAETAVSILQSAFEASRRIAQPLEQDLAQDIGSLLAQGWRHFNNLLGVRHWRLPNGAEFGSLRTFWNKITRFKSHGELFHLGLDWMIAELMNGQTYYVDEHTPILAVLPGTGRWIGNPQPSSRDKSAVAMHGHFGLGMIPNPKDRTIKEMKPEIINEWTIEGRWIPLDPVAILPEGERHMVVMGSAAQPPVQSVVGFCAAAIG